MPELVEKTIRVSDLRKGDIIAQALVGSAHEAPYIVHSIERKVSWSYITLEDGGKPLRWRSDDEVRVQRSQPTVDERAATMRELTVDTLRRTLIKYLRTNPCDELDAIVAKGRAYSTGEVLNWSNLADVLSSQALYKQGAKIRAAIHSRSEYDVNVPDDVLKVDDDTLLDAWAAWYYDEHTRRSAFDSPLNPLSRSTSPLSNLFEDMDRWAVAKVLQDVAWSQSVDELQRRVDRMLAEAKAKQQS